MMSRDPNIPPSQLSDDALTKMISEARTTVREIPSSSADVSGRIARFNELYEALSTKPDEAALIYRDPETRSPKWSAIGKRLLVGRSTQPSRDTLGSVLRIRDEEMSRQHFEIVLADEGIYMLNDSNSLNGTQVDGQKQKTAILIDGSEIQAGTTRFIFTGA